MCSLAPEHGQTSPRRYCGYGIRLYSMKENLSLVHIEEFGNHTSKPDDLGWRFLPPPQERVVLSPSMILEALCSFSRGVKPAKHLQVIAESDALDGSSSDKLDLLHALQLCHRRLASSNEFIALKNNYEEHWVIYLSHIAITKRAMEFGEDVIGVDATL